MSERNGRHRRIGFPTGPHVLSSQCLVSGQSESNDVRMSLRVTRKHLTFNRQL